ncbi:MAG: DUF515 domain-containing protein [Methanobacterium sp.]|jgi:hypothetical protein
MLDKILGKNDKDNNGLDLRKKDKDPGMDVSDRIKNMVSKASNGSKDQINKIKSKSNSNGDEDDKGAKRKIPRPMPKPRPRDTGNARLKSLQKPPEDKKPDGIGGILPGFGRRMPGGGGGSAGGGGPDEDQRTLVGALVFGLILIVLVGAGYYFLVYAPYQGTLNDAKQSQINLVNTYYVGPLATDPEAQTLLSEIESAVTPAQASAVDVIGPATTSWQAYQNQQVNTLKDNYSRVQVNYNNSGTQQTIIMKVSDAQQLISQSDAAVLSNMVITTPNTVAIPLILTRLQAAGGVINVGDAVDIYLNSNGTTAVQSANQTNQSGSTQSSSSTQSSGSTPIVSGATVLALLRSESDSGTISANLTEAQSIAENQISTSSSTSQSSDTDVDQLLRAAASNTWDPTTINALLDNYGYNLNNLERVSNLGDLNAQYLVILEIPQQNAMTVIQNMNSLQLVVPTESAPTWMATELHHIYG